MLADFSSHRTLLYLRTTVLGRTYSQTDMDVWLPTLKWIIFGILRVTAAIQGADPETTRDVGAVRGPRCRQNADGKGSLANNDRVGSPLQRRCAVLHRDIILGGLAVNSAVVCLL